MHLQKLRCTFKDQTSVALITAVTVAWSVECGKNQMGNNREVCFHLGNDTTDHKQCA